jgi:pSer/pThr/pTyr-binding forkhead associated (FHA) protein
MMGQRRMQMPAQTNRALQTPDFFGKTNTGMIAPAKLTVRIPGEPEATHDLGRKTVSIGRAADNDIRIAEISVSYNHAQFSYKRGRYILTDLSSTNGTRVNGYYIKNFKLSDGDLLFFGNVSCLFEMPEHFVVSKLQTSRLLRVSREGKLIGYFTPENARENLARGTLMPDDDVCHDK